MPHLNATELAQALGVSKARISQYVSAGQLTGCYIGEQRARRFDLDQVRTALNKTLDPGQMLGNGAETRRALRALESEAEAKPAARPSTKTDRALIPTDPDRYELARIQVTEEDARRKRRDNQRDEGLWVLAEEVQRHTARALAQELAQIDGFLREAARTLADVHGIDARAARKTLTDLWRGHRTIRSAAAADLAEAATMTPTETEVDA